MKKSLTKEVGAIKETSILSSSSSSIPYLSFNLSGYKLYIVFNICFEVFIISFVFGIFISEAFIYNDIKVEKFESNEVLSEIERLKVSGVYVIGGTDVVSGKIDTVIKNKFNIDVKRIEGSHRYLTAINIAKEIDDFSSIVIAPNANDAIDAAMVASVAGKKGMPIFYSDVKVVNKDLKEYIKSNKKANNLKFVGFLIIICHKQAILLLFQR